LNNPQIRKVTLFRTEYLVLGLKTGSKTAYHNIRTLLGQTWLRHEPVRMCSEVYNSVTSSLFGLR